MIEVLLCIIQTYFADISRMVTGSSDNLRLLQQGKYDTTHPAFHHVISMLQMFAGMVWLYVVVDDDFDDVGDF